MKSVLNIPLTMTPEQSARLEALQRAFAEVCNALGPIVQETRCWNRVGLHHLAYRLLRERFPQMGSQMVCNAIYSVSRTCRIVFQNPASPWNISRLGNQALPMLRFQPNAPVYFDRHTLSLKAGRLSMYTLDGRIRFDVALSKEDEARFQEEKLREIVLSSTSQGFSLSFLLSSTDGGLGDERPATEPAVELPEYLMVTAAEEEEPHPSPPLAAGPIPAAGTRDGNFRINRSC